MIAKKLKEVLINLNVDEDTIEQFNGEKISVFFDVFLKNNRFLTVRALTGDFLNSLGFRVYKGHNEVGDLRRVLSYSFKKYVDKAIKEGKMEKYNTNCFMVKQSG